MEEEPVDNDRIRDISPLERVQRVEQSTRRRDKGKGRKGKQAAREAGEDAAQEPRGEGPVDDASEDEHETPTKGSRLDVRG